VGPDMVVVVAPSLDQNDGLLQVVEDLPVQELVTEFAIEGFAVAVLPGAARFDVGGLHPDMAQPLAQLPGHKLRPVIRPDVGRDAASTHQRGKRLQHVPRLEATGNDQPQALPAEFVQDDQDPEFAPVVSLAADEVVAPDVVAVLCYDFLKSNFCIILLFAKTCAFSRTTRNLGGGQCQSLRR